MANHQSINRSLLLRNIQDLRNKTDNAISYTDLDYTVVPSKDQPFTTHTRSLVCKDDYAVLNAYRLWLQSRRYDYPRAPGFGGLFDMALNDRVYFSVDNEGAVRELVLNETAQKWPGIVVLACEVKAIVNNREWHIKIVAQDKQSKMVLSDSVPVPAQEET